MLTAGEHLLLLLLLRLTASMLANIAPVAVVSFPIIPVEVTGFFSQSKGAEDTPLFKPRQSRSKVA